MSAFDELRRSRQAAEIAALAREALAAGEPTTAEILAAAADARALELSSGDVTFGRRLIFTAGINAISREPAVIDLSTPELIRDAPNTCAVLNQALVVGIRSHLWD
ncbi:MAG: hypothetical protein VW516_08525 [Rhodospirillaceae bacterium]